MTALTEPTKCACGLVHAPGLISDASWHTGFLAGLGCATADYGAWGTDARIRTDDLLRFIRLMQVTHPSPTAIEALDHVRDYVEAIVADQQKVPA